LLFSGRQEHHRRGLRRGQTNFIYLHITFQLYKNPTPWPIPFLHLHSVPCRFQFDKNIIDEAYAVAKLGVIVNSSINFLLYCLSGRRFRNELFIVLRLRSRDSLYSHSTGSSSGGHTDSTAAHSSSRM
jgi:hypothetical protein